MKGITSIKFLDEIGSRDLFFSVSEETVLSVLRKFDVKPPSEWQKLLEGKPQPSWLDWVGKGFQDILQPISNPEYEDKVAAIFNALGFEVEQMGHKKEGEYPDAIVYSEDFAFIHDCKNRSNYFLDARDKRATIKYFQDAKRRVKERKGIEKMYFAFSAHSYDNVELRT